MLFSYELLDIVELGIAIKHVFMIFSTIIAKIGNF